MSVKSIVDAIQSTEVVKLSATHETIQTVDDRILHALATAIMQAPETMHANTTYGVPVTLQLAQDATGEQDAKLAFKVLAGDLRRCLRDDYSAKLCSRTSAGDRNNPAAKVFGWMRLSSPAASESPEQDSGE